LEIDASKYLHKNAYFDRSLPLFKPYIYNVVVYSLEIALFHKNFDVSSSLTSTTFMPLLQN